jgi:hypothetical protein
MNRSQFPLCALLGAFTSANFHATTTDGLNKLFRIPITPTNGTSNGSLSLKSTLRNPNATAATVKLSVADTSVAVVPEPAVALLGGLGLLLLPRRRR